MAEETEMNQSGTTAEFVPPPGGVSLERLLQMEQEILHQHQAFIKENEARIQEALAVIGLAREALVRRQSAMRAFARFSDEPSMADNLGVHANG